MQYETLAYNNAVAAHQATGYQYVYDMTYGNLRRFAVEREPAGGGTYTYTVYQVPLAAGEQAAFDLEKDAIAANGGHSLFYGFLNQNGSGFPVPTGNTETVVNTSASRNQIAAYIAGVSGNVWLDAGLFSLSSIVNATVAILLRSDIISCIVTVYMNDGGQMTFQWTAGAATATFISAVDADMNDIPLTIDHVPGQYTFSHDNGPAFISYLNNKYALNLSVCLNGTLACSGDGHQNYSCTWTHCGGVP